MQNQIKGYQMKLKSTLIMSSLVISTLSGCNLADEKKEADIEISVSTDSVEQIDNSIPINVVENEEDAVVKNENDYDIELD
ncbi:MAG: hypothetical protein C4617_04510 [Candidatus Liberibacter europaeus]|uniref:Uncharacterized protein n=1 Tax=Candidatus Liberibacter europaeus TaxID=744859 RepID=A0A2T4VWX2_9HYPH|nr:MAG: hypothetical protein C4617_04510 [Candidatus Liberibacter europaeus]